MKGHMEDGKFHPHTDYKKGVRKSRDQTAKTKGVKVNNRKARQIMQLDMSDRERMEWERVVGSEVVKVKHEMMNGMPVTSVRFENGEEWFEFDEISHQEEFMKDENIEVDESIIEEFVEIDHPDIAGYITMETGKVLFGEKENHSRKSRGSMTEILPTQGKANVKLHTSGRGNRGTQFTLGIGNQLSDIGIWNVSQSGIDQIESTIIDASRQGQINSKDDMFELSRILQSIIEERIEDGDIK